MKKFCCSTALFSLLVFFASCSQEETKLKTETPSRPTIPITTNEVQIGNQIWMTKNLDVTRYRNGDIIPQVQDPTAWANLMTGAWCYYANNTANGTTYGKLYNGYAVLDPRGLAPTGWHIPTNEEWTTLQNYLGGNTVAGGKMKATTLWLAPNTGATNSSGFTALPGGARGSGGAFFGPVLNAGYWWSSADAGATSIWQRQIQSDWAGLTSFLNTNIRHGFSVRCIKNIATDIDGNQYREVTIGNQVWIKSNLNVSRYRNGDPIPQVQDSFEWQNLTTGAWCYYNNDSRNGAKYGKLYNWYAVNDPRGLAPVGYHIPSDDEWTILTNNVGDGNALKGGFWGGSFPVGCEPTNTSGFTGLPGGWRDDIFGAFNGIGDGCLWWSSTVNQTPNGNFPWRRSLNRITPGVYRMDSNKKNGYSIRCIRD